MRWGVVIGCLDGLGWGRCLCSEGRRGGEGTGQGKGGSEPVQKKKSRGEFASCSSCCLVIVVLCCLLVGPLHALYLLVLLSLVFLWCLPMKPSTPKTGRQVDEGPNEKGGADTKIKKDGPQVPPTVSTNTKFLIESKARSPPPGLLRHHQPYLPPFSPPPSCRAREGGGPHASIIYRAPSPFILPLLPPSSLQSYLHRDSFLLWEKNVVPAADTDPTLTPLTK